MISPHRPPVVKKFEADLVVLVRGHDQIKIKSARIVRSPRGHRQSSTCGSRQMRSRPYSRQATVRGAADPRFRLRPGRSLSVGDAIRRSVSHLRCRS
jgi:hypothetical protein